MSVSTADLKRLGEVKAPAGLAERVLAEAGLADEYARFDTVIGAVFVAWNRNGVSAAARSRSAHEFEEYFRAELGRRPESQESDPESRGSAGAAARGAGARGRALPGCEDDGRLLLSHVPPRAPRARAQRGVAARRGRGEGGGLSPVQGLPAGRLAQG